MTYRELLEQLQQLNEDQLNMDIYVYDMLDREYAQESVKLAYAAYDCETLGLDQPVICF